MIVYKLSLKEKLKLLLIIWLKKLNLLTVEITYKRIPLNEYSKELLNDSDWYTINELFGRKIEYKKAVDPTGQNRFFIPKLDKEAVFRIDEKYSFKDGIRLPDELLSVYIKEGRDAKN